MSVTTFSPSRNGKIAQWAREQLARALLEPVLIVATSAKAAESLRRALYRAKVSLRLSEITVSLSGTTLTVRRRARLVEEVRGME